MKGIAASTIAGCFALAAFVVAIIAGLSSGNPAHAILWRAVIAMIVCYPVGFGVGMVAQHVIREHVEAHRKANPECGDAPDVETPALATELDEHGDPTDEEVLVA